MPPKPTTAQSAAISASKRKNATIDINFAAQEKLKSFINAFEHAYEHASTPAIHPHATDHYISSINQLYTELVSQGFTDPQIQRCMYCMPLHALSIGPLLDWLLVHIDRSELPKIYADQIQSTSNVELLHRASSALNISHRNSIEIKAQRDINQEKERNTQEQKERAMREEAERRKKDEAREQQRMQEEAQRRAWILQYAEAYSSSSSEYGAHEDDDIMDNKCSQSTDDSDVDDWEIWGDQKEKEENRAAKKRASLPRKQRLILIARELAEAKSSAMESKSAKNKAGQQAAGQKIGRLKKEMAELGISDECELPEVELSYVDETFNAQSLQEADRTANTDDGIQMHDGILFTDIGKASDATTVNDSEDQLQIGFDLFDPGNSSTADTAATTSIDGIAAIDDPDAKRKAAQTYAKRVLEQEDMLSTVVSSSAPPNFKKGKSQSATTKHSKKKQQTHMKQQPKILLQQLFKQQGWPQPRFEKLTIKTGAGEGERNLHGARYSIAVDIQDPGKGPSVRRWKLDTLPLGQYTCTVPDQDDGWEKVEDAQHAVATLALLQFYSKVLKEEEKKSLWKQLPMPFCELYLVWEAEGRGNIHAVGETEDKKKERLNFIQQLVVEKLETEWHHAMQYQQRQLNDTQSNGKDASTWYGSIQRSIQKHLEAQKKNASKIKEESKNMHDALQAFRSSSEGKSRQSQRGKLPASLLRHDLLEHLQNQDVVVVSGETGSGKTTQIPQFLLEGETEQLQGGCCSIVCTQPRRIAAISVAERVAVERGEPLPGEPGSRVGYAVRLDTATSPSTKLLFCTTGILLRRLAGDPGLCSITHVVIDEVHERTMQGDFLMALLKEVIGARRDAGHPLKVILMSATLDAELISNYFGGCPALHAAGRTFPVQQLYLEDVYKATGYVVSQDSPVALRQGDGGKYGQRRAIEKAVRSRHQSIIRSGWGDDSEDGPPLNPRYKEELYEGYSSSVHRNLARLDEDRIDFDLIEDLVAYIHETEEDDGAILVFLPGIGEITNLLVRLQSRGKVFDSRWIIPLHSTVAPADQRRAFKVPPKGVRKVVLATNIAETSLTIEDVVYVVDTGRLKERRYDPARSMSLLVEDWVSKANAKQRRGRAGRVKEGICYALYTKHRFDFLMKEYQTPEMLRVPLEELVLQVLLLKVGNNAGEFLSKVMQPPSEKAIEGAMRVLRQVGAVTVENFVGDGGSGEERLSPLGYHLAQLPVDVRVGKLLILASILGCLSPALSIAACLSHKTPFGASAQQHGDVDAARKALCASGSGTIAANQQSDHLVMAAAMQGWMEARRKGGASAAAAYAKTYCLVPQTLEMLADMRGQFATMLADGGFAQVYSDRGSPSSSSLSWYDDDSLMGNAYAARPAVVKAALFAALYPSIAVMDDASLAAATGSSRQLPLWHDGTGPVAVHPSSLLSSLEIHQYHRPFLTYLEKMRTSQVFMRDCTVVSPSAIVLFGGRIEVDHAHSRVLIDGWIQIKVPAHIAALIGQLRRSLEQVLKKKVMTPKGESSGESDASAQQRKVVEAIVHVLDHEEVSLNWDT